MLCDRLSQTIAKTNVKRFKWSSPAVHTKKNITIYIVFVVDKQQ